MKNDQNLNLFFLFAMFSLLMGSVIMYFVYGDSEKQQNEEKYRQLKIDSLRQQKIKKEIENTFIFNHSQIK